MAGRVPLRSPGTTPAGAPRLTGAQISAINRFPDDNPNPVMRVDAGGTLVYANPPSTPILGALGITVGGRLAADMLAELDRAAEARSFVELVAGRRTYAVWPVPIRDLGFTNLYGQDVTAERAIVKFPDENPHPVLRLARDGTLEYANPASDRLVRGLNLTVGLQLPAPLRERLLASVSRADHAAVEVSVRDGTFELLAVDVPAFGFINVYGTDVSAVREREQLALENERLLLNILPEPIASRLRNGEPLIADRFDDVTLLFADVVEFTRLSSSMTPSELVGVLNDTFTAFDDLVERHRLEKVKTIGDAYMVVGGMPERSDDHTARVASMALDMSEAVGRLDTARRLGIQFRIGVHCGPVVAGVIGTKKFIYDVWGDTVNLASRMESLGIPGRVQVTQAVMERLNGSFQFEPRGLLDVKGKGRLPTYFLLGRGSGARGVSVRTMGSSAALGTG